MSSIEQDILSDKLNTTLTNTVIHEEQINTLEHSNNLEEHSPPLEEHSPPLEHSNNLEEQSNNLEQQCQIKSVKPILDFNMDSRGGLLYDIIHIFDNVYSYGRTLIENNYFNFADNADFNLVYPNIYIGNYSTSTNLELLQGVGITHIISVIPTFNPPFPDKFKYLHIAAYDDETQEILQYVDICNAFIGDVLSEGGKVLIHCMVGRSRSISIFIAFLINILKGRFDQTIVNLDADNDVSNEMEYKQIIGAKRKVTFNPDVVDIGSSSKEVEMKNMKEISYVTNYVHPELNNKHRAFMLYKKETMIKEIYTLMETYNQRENEKQKQNFSLMTDILKYVVKYRKQSDPNPYFIEQLTTLL